jgi:cobalt/nickel transport system permease protein
MNPIVARILFVLFFFGILSIRESRWLLPILPLLWALSWREFFRLNRRVVRAFLLFNLGISLGYLLVAWWRGISPWEYLLYINLKVYLLSYFVFWFFSRVNVVEFFAFSRELGYLLTITLSQIISYRKSFSDFRLAWKARQATPLRRRERAFIGRTFEHFYRKALRDSRERSLAMKARGFF